MQSFWSHRVILAILLSGGISAGPALAVPFAAVPPSRSSVPQRGSVPTSSSDSSYSPAQAHALVAAVQARDVVAARQALSLGANPDTRRRAPRGEPVLLSALIAGDAEMVSTLLAYGANASARDGRGTPLLVAVASLISGSPESVRRLEAVRVLLEQGHPEINAADKAKVGDDRAALHMAAANGSAPLAELLLIHGADPHLRNRFGETPISFAAEKGHVTVARLLVAKGASPNVVTMFTRMSPLMAAAGNGHADMVLYLLSLRANPSGRNAFGEDSLTLARAARSRVPASESGWRDRIDVAVNALEQRL